jgi:hypothetical protein
MFRTIRLAALALVMTLGLSGLALAHDDDHDRDDDHHRDRHARRDRDHDRDRDRDRDHDRDDRWRHHDNGRHEGWYRGRHRGDGDRDDDDRYRNGGYSGRDNRGGYVDRARYDRGFRDGQGQARRDVSQHKPFHPDPRGGEDRGPDYNRGYRAGYQSMFRGRY